MAATTEQRDASSSPLNVVDVRNELLGMLERAGKAAPPPRPAPSSPGESGLLAVPSTAAAAPSRAAAPAREVPDDPNVTCVKCGNTDSWGTASWCPKCGYYPTIGHDGEVPQEEEDGIDKLTLADLFPAWIVQIVGGVAGICIFTVALEIFLAGSIGWLSLASLVQLSFGCVIILFAHKQAIMMGLHEPGNPGVLSLLTYPPAVWLPVFKNLRERAHLVVTLVWGITASVSAFSIYGPIQMAEIKKELAETRKDRKPLMGKMVGAMTKLAGATSGPMQPGGAPGAGQLPGDGSIEGAVAGFAGLATQQGGLAEVSEGVRTGRVDGIMTSSPGGIPGGGGIQAGGGATSGGGAGLGSLNLSSGVGGSGTDSLEGAIGSFAGAATSQSGLSDPEQLTRAVAGSITAGSTGTGAVSTSRSGGVSGIAGKGSSGPQIVQTTTPSPVPAVGGSTTGGASTVRASTGGAADRPELTEVVVFGYLKSAGGEIRSLLIAKAGATGGLRFGGKIGSEDMSADHWNSIVEALPDIRTRRPLVFCPNSGFWVEPKFILNIASERWTSTGPVDPQVHSIEVR